MADSKLSALPQQSVPALGDFTYIDDITGPTSNKQSWDRILGQLLTLPPQLRLTTESGVPVSTSDRTAQGTLFYTPYIGKIITIFDGTRWRAYSTPEISTTFTLANGKNADIFVFDNAGVVTLELSAAWTNDSTRADALALQDGVFVKSGTPTRRWVGTIRASGANVVADAVLTRYVWNAYNWVPRHIQASDGGSHTINNVTQREWNAGTAVRANFILGAITQSVLMGGGCYMQIGTVSTNAQFNPAANGVALSSAPAGDYFGGAGLNGYLTPDKVAGFTPLLGFNYITLFEAEFGSLNTVMSNGHTEALVLG